MVDTQATTEPGVPPSAAIPVRTPEFGELVPNGIGSAETPMDRFFDVTVTVWAELGRVQLPLRELLRLGEGSVLKLDRPISAPVDLVAQGVCFARGEVVVVEDYFAIRIKEIDSSRRPRSMA